MDMARRRLEHMSISVMEDCSDCVECPICRLAMGSLMAHVRSKHMPLEEFKALYPQVDLVSSRSKAMASESCQGKGRPRGIPASDEQKKRLSALNTGQRNPFFGKKHSIETRQLMIANHADVSGNNNPNRKWWQTASPEEKADMSAMRRELWRACKNDPARFAARCEKLSSSMIAAHREGKLAAYGRGHRNGHFLSRFGPIFFRSSYELRFLEWCERSSKVQTFGPCTTSVTYMDDKGVARRYLPDFLVNGRIVVEIKPKSMLNIGVVPTKTQAALLHCAGHGLTYRMITEDDLINLESIEW